MKPRLCLQTPLLVALGAILAGPLSATPPQAPAMMYRVSAVWSQGAPNIKVGTADSTVRYFLGSPTRRPVSNVWIYHRFVADLDEANSRDCSSLVITFANGRVTSLRLVNENAVTVIAAQAKTNPAEIPAMLVVSAE